MAGPSAREDVVPPPYKGYCQRATIAVVNFHAEWGDKRTNLERMKEYIKEAAREGADLILFPELALTGYEVDEGGKMHKELAETIPGPTSAEMAKLSKELDIYVAWGMPEFCKENNAYYNSAVLVGPEGLLGVYRKVHPWMPELQWCSKGNEYPIFVTKFGPICIGICYDTYFFPEVARIYALKGARLYLNPTAMPVLEGFNVHELMLQQIMARAAENLYYVASADLVGREKTMKYAGYSVIAGPLYPKASHIHAGPASKEEEGMLMATLDLVDVHRMRNTIPVFEDRRPETYKSLISGVVHPGKGLNEASSP